MSEKPLKISGLLQVAESSLKQTLPWTSATQIIPALGLDNYDEFTPAQVTMFVSACHLVLNEGKSIEQMKIQLGISAILDNIETDATKKSQMAVQQLGTAMTKIDQEMEQQIPALMQQTLQEWINSGLVDLIAQEARRRILKAEASGKPLEKDFTDWCIAQHRLLPQLQQQLLNQRRSKSDR